MSILDDVERLLPRCGPTSLDQLDRSLYQLAAQRVFETWALLGCWIVDAERYCVVLRRGADTVGLVSGPDGLPEPAAEHLAQWRSAGWVSTDVVWSVDPADLGSPWGSRPPRPGDARHHESGIIAWDDAAHGPRPPDASADDHAIMDLHQHIQHSMWSETAGVRYLTVHRGGLRLRSSLRLAAFWVTAPDSFAVIEAHIWPRYDAESDEALLRATRLPGQQYLRFGEQLAPNPYYSWSWIIDDLQHQKELDNVYVYPTGALHGRDVAHGVAWRGEQPPGGVRMADHLHAVLDRDLPALPDPPV
ncbi:hypothetical protein ACQBAU_15700 [Propionibacteriaceae bacterium Y2011]